ncbi:MULTISPECIES: EAL domain-containing protein [Pseudomonas]|uniref:EAL domain-containing response regulator n=1 Tax=Pseudomonas TaxID=286 RepID=UPI000B35F5AA|nr:MULTISPECIES: EAL domain-containing response regulator [Pseudomonas]PMY68985.1 oxygen-sensing cyclic-di-GMP phosphodiesterase [Pseudomonas sp. FW305-25]PMY74618.1 oxygen-sensing cyclic-di-GMP phosphodiesterase [Pseudomonas sp. FW126-L8]PNA82944.1 oxygen-sensing cyclic-di-GMP phosphodiesterase [Pseudomonas sp. FW305-76]
MPMLPLRILVLGDMASHCLRVANVLRQSGCQEVFVAVDEGQALASLEQIGPVDVTLCVLRKEGGGILDLLQAMGRSGLAGSIIISSTLSADARSVPGQLISLLGMALLGDVSKPLQPGALQLLLAKHLNEPINESGVLPVVPATEEEVRRALAGHQLHTYFQPKFNLQTGDVCSIEALARWHHPFKGVLPPSVFMPVIERCGWLDELLFLQLEQGLRLQRQALNQGFALNVAFNLHAGQLVNPDLTGRIQTILAAHDLPGSGLTFELTETGLLEAPAISLESLVRLRMMGCSLSIDDFGAGFSSLQRLCQLPFNEIKLDGEFVRGLKHEPRRRAVISSTLALGEALGMSVVVEGIETEEQRKVLLELGCKQGQGYLCARPMSAASLLNWLDLQRGAEASY